MSTGDSSDIQTRLQLALPKLWYPSDGTVIGAMLGAMATSWAWLYSLYAYIKLQSRILTASDGWLDVIAGDFFGSAIVRKANQTDASFRATIIANLFREKATRNAIVLVLKALTGRVPVIIEPQRPADLGAYGAAVAVTRSSIATYFDSTGVLQYAPVNQVRYSYNPLNLSTVPVLLIEAAATNLLTYSSQFDNAVWNKNSWGGVGVVVANDATYTAPDGTLSVDKYTPTVGNSGICTGITLTAGVTYTWSIYAVDPLGGSILSISSSAALFIPVATSVAISSTGLRRTSITYTPTVTGTYYPGFVCSGNARPIYIWGAQLEVGSSATSYIPSTNVAGVRSADTLLNNMTTGSVALGGYGSAGAYGSMLIPYQAFVQAYRPLTSGIPNIAGYGNAPAAYGIASQGGEYASISMVQGFVQDADIYAAVSAVAPAASTIWTKINS